MHLCNIKVRDALNRQNKNYKMQISVDFDWTLNGLKIQVDLIKIIAQKMIEIVEKEVIQETEAGENNKKLLEDHLHMKKEAHLVTFKMNNWYKHSNLNILVIYSNNTIDLGY